MLRKKFDRVQKSTKGTEVILGKVKESLGLLGIRLRGSARKPELSQRPAGPLIPTLTIAHDDKPGR